MFFDKCLIVLLPIVICSKVKSKMESFIIGGDYGRIHAHPHMVYLDIDCGFVWTCGGSILNQKIILTAGHCLSACELNRYHRIYVSAGHEETSKMPITRRANKIIVHDDYDEDTVENDIGLVSVTYGLIFGKNIKRVIINRSFPKGMVVADLAGWGLVNERTEELAQKLKWIQQKLRTKATCAKAGRLHPGMFCAGTTNNFDDRPSSGDSGGALIVDRVWEIGILSWNHKNLKALSIYTNVSYYYNWIVRNTKTLYCASR